MIEAQIQLRNQQLISYQSKGVRAFQKREQRKAQDVAAEMGISELVLTKDQVRDLYILLATDDALHKLKYEGVTETTNAIMQRDEIHKVISKYMPKDTIRYPYNRQCHQHQKGFAYTLSSLHESFDKMDLDGLVDYSPANLQKAIDSII